MPKRNTRWYNERDEEEPDFRADSQIYSLRSVNHAVESACLGGGTIFQSINNYAYNHIYMPLMTVTEQMKVLMRTMDRWAFRAKFLQHMNPELSRIFRSTRITETLKFKKIHRRLDKISLLDFEYCDVFLITSEKLVPILEAINSLIAFLDAICTEGNLLSFENSSHPTISSSIASAPEETDPVNHHSTLHSTLEEADPATVTRSPTPGPAYYEYTPLSASPSPTPPHPTTPQWKLGLAHKYSVDNLYVGETELEVFAKALTYAREARDEVVAADKTCFDLSDVALNMLPVFELWMERCDKFEEARIKAERGNESPRGYKTYDGGFEALPPSVSAYEGWGVQPSIEGIEADKNEN